MASQPANVTCRYYAFLRIYNGGEYHTLILKMRSRLRPSSIVHAGAHVRFKLHGHVTLHFEFDAGK